MLFPLPWRAPPSLCCVKGCPSAKLDDTNSISLLNYSGVIAVKRRYLRRWKRGWYRQRVCELHFDGMHEKWGPVDKSFEHICKTEKNVLPKDKCYMCRRRKVVGEKSNCVHHDHLTRTLRVRGDCRALKQLANVVTNEAIKIDANHSTEIVSICLHCMNSLVAWFTRHAPPMIDRTTATIPRNTHPPVVDPPEPTMEIKDDRGTRIRDRVPSTIEEEEYVPAEESMSIISEYDSLPSLRSMDNGDGFETAGEELDDDIAEGEEEHNTIVYQPFYLLVNQPCDGQ